MIESASRELPRWWTPKRGDVDATIGQVGFNLAQVIMPVFLLLPAGIPLEFAVTHFLPGYASGFLIGSLGLSYLAVRLMRREKRIDVAAHPYGNNVPAIIAYTLSIMLPIYLQTHDQVRAWQMGAAAVIWTGVIKMLAVPFAGHIRRVIPLPAIMTVFGAAMYSYLALTLLQRLFDQPLIGLLALTIIAITALSRVSITQWRIPPFLAAWILPLVVGLSIGYVHPRWHGMTFQLPFVWSAGPIHMLRATIPYLSVIGPIAIYQILQDIASVEGATVAGDNYDLRAVIFWDAVGTVVCGVCGSIVSPTVYALHPPYKAIGARIGFSIYTPIIFLGIVVSGLTLFLADLFPWPILAAMIAYVAVGVGTVTLQSVDKKYLSALLLGFTLPIGAVVSSTIRAALPALKISAENPMVQRALNGSVYWASLNGLGNGFLFLVLVTSAIISEIIDRNPGRASIWCLVASTFSWFGLMHSSVFRWGAQPMYALGWVAASALVYTSRWWGSEVRADSSPRQTTSQ